MSLLIALCYFIVISSPPPPELGTGGILVNYGTSPEGMGTDYMSTEEPSKAEHPNHARPTKVTPTPPTPQKAVTEQSDKKVVTQNTEDAPEVNSSKKPNKVVSTEQPAKPAKPTLNQNALYKGKSNGASGEGDGTTNTPGNQGNPNGSTLTNNYNGTGSGNGGLQMAQRNFVNKPSVSDDNRRAGRVVVDIRVDKNGNVVYASAGAKGTTITDAALLQKCEDAVRNSKLNSSENAPDNQVGKVVFVFKVN